jgi:hypothetical protein
MDSSAYSIWTEYVHDKVMGSYDDVNNRSGLHHAPRQNNDQEMKRSEECSNLYLEIRQCNDEVFTSLFQAFDDEPCEVYEE